MKTWLTTTWRILKMEFRVHKKLYENINIQQKDIALITVPGMGLSTLLTGLTNEKNIFVFIKPESIQGFWDNEYKANAAHHKFVIHTAMINALIENNIYQGEIDIRRTSLKKLFTQYKPLVPFEKFYFVIDNFGELDDELEKVILNELKAISDQKETSDKLHAFNSIRFMIGGCVDFQNLYPEKDSGTSPATNFCKHYPEEFLLSYNEISNLLKDEYPDILHQHYALPLIYEWTSGYLHYVEYLAKWISEQLKEEPALSLEILISRFQDEIEENKQIPLFKYCRKSWNKVKTSNDYTQILKKAIKSPFIRDSSIHTTNLMKLGLLLNSHTQKRVYQIPNRIVWMYLRQRLSESNFILPINESPNWGLMEYNSKAYSLLFEIENTLRSYIGDILLEKSNKNGVNWKDYLDIEFDKKNILNEAEERRKKDTEDMNSGSSNLDPILGFLDFPDLGFIIIKYEQDFPRDFSQLTPVFLRELNYFRRRIAHNRSMTHELITTVESRWKQMKNMMLK